MTPFRCSRRVDFCDTDMVGIVHFANYFRYMEFAEVEFLRSLGLSVKLLHQEVPIGFPRVSVGCDYIRPLRFDDVVDIDVAIERIGSKSISYRFAFTLAGQPIATGRSTAVCCRMAEEQKMESMEIPEEIRKLLQSRVDGK
ncbi:MAG: acyl-CoA thioesterase [Gemmataceae bacterium]|nr:acyl-CoA thioesterase [Gemmataceae bacterium]